MVPSMPARALQRAFHCAEVCWVRALASASCSSREPMVIWRRRLLVHSWRAGQGAHAVAGQDTTIASSWRWRHGGPGTAGDSLRAGRLPGVEVEGERGLVIPGAGPGLGGVVQPQRDGQRDPEEAGGVDDQL